jgi:hypothetical protein
VTPLVAAVREDRRDAVATLLRLGANPRKETLDGVRFRAFRAQRRRLGAILSMQLLGAAATDTPSPLKVACTLPSNRSMPWAWQKNEA